MADAAFHSSRAVAACDEDLGGLGAGGGGAASPGLRRAAFALQQLIDLYAFRGATSIRAGADDAFVDSSAPRCVCGSDGAACAVCGCARVGGCRPLFLWPLRVFACAVAALSCIREISGTLPACTVVVVISLSWTPFVCVRVCARMRACVRVCVCVFGRVLWASRDGPPPRWRVVSDMLLCDLELSVATLHNPAVLPDAAARFPSLRLLEPLELERHVFEHLRHVCQVRAVGLPFRSRTARSSCFTCLAPRQCRWGA